VVLGQLRERSACVKVLSRAEHPESVEKPDEKGRGERVTHGFLRIRRLDRGLSLSL
jgi:hypothetical protein